MTEVGKLYLSYLEIDITNKCNLNCAYCSHFSSLSNYNVLNYNIKIFTADIIELSKKFIISTIHIVGGEPFLVSDLLYYVKIIRKYFPYSKINIVSNGILIDRINLIKEKLNENNIGIKISNYPNFTKFTNNAKPIYKFRNLQLTETERFNAEESKLNCHAKNCLSLYNGKIYYCPIMKNLETIEKAFNLNFNLSDNERGIDIYNNSANEILLELFNENRWKKLCSHCSPIWPEKDWKLSEKEMKEWIIEK